MIGKTLKAALLSLGMLGTLGNSALASETDVFGGQTFCEFHESYLKEAFSSFTPSGLQREAVEKDFAAKYVSGLRSGALARPSVARLVVPLAKEGGRVVVSYNPALDTLSVSGDVSAESTLQLNRSSHSGVRLDLEGRGEVLIDPSLSQAALRELYVFAQGGDLFLQGSAPCALVDAGREEATGPVKIDASALVPPSGSDVSIACSQSFYGTNYGDRLIGSACNDYLYGYFGQDWLDGREGSDTSFGNEDGDCLAPGPGASYSDWLYGGKGSDFLYADTSYEYCYGDTDHDGCSSSCYVRNGCESTYHNCG